MLPNYFQEIKSNYKQYFDSQFPITQNCVDLNQQIIGVNSLIEQINQRITSNKIESETENLRLSGFLTRANSLNYLKILLNEKHKTALLSNCGLGISPFVENTPKPKPTNQIPGNFVVEEIIQPNNLQDSQTNLTPISTSAPEKIIQVKENISDNKKLYIYGTIGLVLLIGSILLIRKK